MKMQLRSKVKQINQKLDTVGTTDQPNKRGRMKKIIETTSSPTLITSVVFSGNGSPEKCVQNELLQTNVPRKVNKEIKQCSNISIEESPINILDIRKTDIRKSDIRKSDMRKSDTATTSKQANSILDMMDDSQEQIINKINSEQVEQRDKIVHEYQSDTHVYLDPIELNFSYHTCEICLMQFNSIQAVKCHYKLKHPHEIYKGSERAAKPAKIQCDICIDHFTEPSHLKSHYKLKHKKKLIFDSFQCQKCTFSSNSKRDMEKHMNGNHMATFTCSICLKQYSNLRSLNNHRRAHPESFNANMDGSTYVITEQIRSLNTNIPDHIPIKTLQKGAKEKARLDPKSKREKHKSIAVQQIENFINETDAMNINQKYEALLTSVRKLTKNLRIYHGINNSTSYFKRKSRKRKEDHNRNNDKAETIKEKGLGSVHSTIANNIEKIRDEDVSNEIPDNDDMNDTQKFIDELIEQVKSSNTFEKNDRKSSNSKYMNKDLLNQFFKNPRNCYRLITSDENRIPIVSTVLEVYQHYQSIWNTSSAEISSNESNNLYSLFDEIAEEEIVNSMEKMNQRSANGTDKLHFLVWKFLNKKTNILGKIFNHFLDLETFPESWRESRTVLLTKDKSKPNDVSNLRPITISNSIYRIFSNVIKGRFEELLSKLDIMSKYQKGFQSKINGCLEHSYTIKSVIDQARNERKNCEIFFIDVKSAFDKVSHNYILNKLKSINLQSKDIKMINQMLKGFTNIKVNKEETDRINFLSGVKQGDPISPLLFNLAINDAIKAVNAEDDNSFITNILGYADDLTIIAKDKDTMLKNISILSEKLAEAGLSINMKKCKSLSLNFDTNLKVFQQTYNINGQVIESIKYLSSFNYLGRNVDLKSTYETANLESISEDLTRELDKVRLVNLPNWTKISLIKMFLISKFNFILALSKTKKSSLKPIDDMIKEAIYYIYRLPSSTTSEFFYMSARNGGLGLRKLAEDKNIVRVNSFINLLNTRDEKLFMYINEQIKKILGITIEIPTIKLIEELYDFKFSNVHQCSNIISDSIKELNRLNVKIVKTETSKYDIDIAGNDNEKSPLRRLRKLISYKHFEQLDKMQDQGRYLRTISRFSASNFFLSPFKGLAPEIQEFAVKARVNQLLTPANMKKWNVAPRFYKAKCPVCVTATYNLSHILNGCARYRKLYTERHNSIIDIITKQSKIKLILNERTITNESPLRPDIQIYDINKGEAILADLAVSSDLMDTLAFSAAGKISKYMIFEDSFQKQNLRLKVIPIIVGSLGTIQRSLPKDLIVLGIPEKSVKKTIKIIIMDVLEKSFQIYLRAKQDFPANTSVL